ncbi:GIY-YIG nuclease family protein [Aquibaculum arenosum]|uniref:GIY-YIG nuclease family protein n=1 Tax=Aquibaculum arenosum TaxID=3032591 RepID=A0ABT5YNW7_9PROT|nr:GIY-YIG nuclease family protein [Fodinicurvata sp. CAU 1616]MDF2096650.1 GIY-YIG nuclease family protein [Fodinicurvata sp. CAU 1616]
MANKLAGQRAKFSRARSLYFTAPDDDARSRAIELMAEVLQLAPSLGFTEDMVTQGEDVPDVVRERLHHQTWQSAVDEDPDQLVEGLAGAVDTSDLMEAGSGSEWVYAYGYACAPDRLKIGSSTGDVVARVAAQIGTGTPDKPRLLLKIAIADCRALERALHGILRVRGLQIEGAGSEWFRVQRDELLSLYTAIVGDPQ